MKLLGVLSPAKNSAVSLDLLNLYVVNQISCKKQISETVRKPIHVNMNRDIKMPLRKHDLELPVSPDCVPSKLCLDDTDNNIHCQRLASEEKVDSIQSSQVMDSCGISEPEVNRRENCRFSPSSFSAELSSNSHIPKQNFNPQRRPSPWKVAYEQKQNEQPSEANYSRSLLCKLNESQDALSSSYKATQFGTLFEGLNSPGNGKILTERPAVIMGEDYRSVNRRRESNFIIEKQIVQPLWGENEKAVLNCIEDAKQPNPSSLSENRDSFINQNMINLLNLDQQKIKENIDRYGCDSTGDVCEVTNFIDNCFTDRCVTNIFTVPELTYSDSAFNKTSNPEKYQLNKSYQKEYNNNERSNFGTSFEKHCYPASSEKTGKYEHNYQKKIPQEKFQKSPVNNTGNIPLEDVYSKQSWDIRVGEILMEERGTFSLKSSPTSTKKIYLDSPKSSQSTGYSPRQTDSCFSSSSEMPSEDEEQALQQSGDSNRRFIKSKETANSVYLNRMSKLPDDEIVKNNSNIPKQNDISHQSTMNNNTDQFLQSQCNSAYMLQNTPRDCILQVVKCDASVQTESECATGEKLDAAIQCDIISKCECGSDVSSLCHVERCSENIKADNHWRAGSP